MHDKKAQGISLNVIIIAAIALIVMVVLIMIFTGKIGFFVTESETCSSKGGQCVNSDECTGTLAKQITAVCDVDGNKQQDEGKICCLKVGQ